MNLPLIRLDPAADPEEWGNAAEAIREVTSPADRAIGARVTNSPQWQGAAVIGACSEPLEDADGDTYTPALDELARDLKSKFAKVRTGDLSDPEAMLLAQAHSLQSIFCSLALKALGQVGLPSMQMCMSVALKAQAQSRATLSALADMKNPRQPNFIGQQNVAVNQQVNNPLGQPSNSANGKDPPIKLLEAKDGERLDGGTARATSRTDSRLGTLVAVNGTANREGQGSGC